MRFAVVGLGRMGASLAALASESGHDVVGYDVWTPARERFAAGGGRWVSQLSDLRDSLERRRTVLLYVPHGVATDVVAEELLAILDPGDLVADCGNSHWRDSARRHQAFSARGIAFADVGTSGGVEGARTGAAFMVGGASDTYERMRPLLLDLAVGAEGVHHVGGPGAGHFVKLVHNAIEFGMIQSIAEGVALLRAWDEPLDLAQLFGHWSHGTVIRSWLVELMGEALEEHDTEALSPFVEDTGEVKWILEWATARDVPLPCVSSAQTALMTYRDRDSAAAKAVALLRNAFGGHPLHVKEGQR